MPLSRRLPLLLALVCSAPLLLTACGDDGRVEAGSIYAARDAYYRSAPIVAETPGTEVTTRIGPPLDVVTRNHVVTKAEELDAPKGGALLAVRTEFRGPRSDLYSWGGLDADQRTTSVAIRAAGHDYPIADSVHDGDSARTQYLAVPTAEGLRLAVTYDGLTQLFDVASGARTAGSADDLYRKDAGDGSRVACPHGPDTMGRLDVLVDCRVSVQHGPWAQHWAAAGHRFAIVEVDLGAFQAEWRGRPGSGYRPTSPSATLSVDGGPARPVRARAVEGRGVDAEDTLTAEVATGRRHTADLRLHVVWVRAAKGPEAGPERVSATLVRHLDLGSF